MTREDEPDPAAPADDIDDAQPVPLSNGQWDMWMAQQLEPSVPLNVAQYIELRGELDLDVLCEAVIRAGAEFQTGFVRLVEVDGDPHQLYDPLLDAEITVIDMREEPDPMASALEWMHSDYSAPIDLMRDRLAASAILRVGEHHYLWYSRIHHILADGYAAMMVVNRTASLYSASIEGHVIDKNRALDLRSLYEMDQHYRESARFTADQAYWKEKLPTVVGSTSLANSSRKASARPVGLVATAELSAKTWDRIEHNPKGLAQAAIVIAAFQCYLARVTGREQVLVEILVSGRTTAVLRRSGGLLVNVMPLPMSLDKMDTVEVLVRRVQWDLLGALRHQRYGLADIHAGTGQAERYSGPAVNIMLFHPEIRLGPMQGEFHILTAGPVEDLLVNLYRGGARSQTFLDFVANPARYTDTELSWHHTRFLEFLDIFLSLLDNPRAYVADIDLMGARERHHILAEWNDTGHPQTGTDVAALFTAQALRSPSAEAVVYEGQRLTYADFDRRTNRLARRLIAAGVGPETRVALALRRSVDLLVGLYAVVKSGAAFIPLDPDDPSDRLSWMLADAGPRCVLTRRGDDDHLPDGGSWSRIDELDPLGFPDHPVTDADRIAPLRVDNAAYVIYTSGSTGHPKGVEVTHRAAVNMLTWIQNRLPIRAGDRVIAKAPMTFDMSVEECFAPLGVGATVVVARHDGHRDPDYLVNLIERERVTIVDFVPSMLDVLLTEPGFRLPRSVTMVLVGGEAVSAATAARVLAGGVRLGNFYGPTETTVNATYLEVEDASSRILIGRPIGNTTAYVLDRRLRPVPPGMTGELYLGGVQLARGYIGQVGLTAGRFVAHPYGVDGERLYRTGDLVRWTHDGHLDFVERIDFQIKLRGQRVEPGEIEATLSAHPAVRRAVVLLRRDPPNNEYLAAYLLAVDGRIDEDELTRFLSRRLPAYAVPRHFVQVDEFPLTNAGKLDRPALPAPPRARRACYSAPRTPTEAMLADVFTVALGVNRVGRDDDFFALGGNSMSATRAVARITAATGIRLDLATFFDASTPALLTSRLSDSSGADRSPVRPWPRPLPALIPLSPAQRGMWFVNQYDPTSPAYNLPLTLRLTGHLDTTALASALADVVERHESLRTAYPASAAGPHRTILPASQAVSALAPTVMEDPRQEPRILCEFASEGFDVATAVPVRAALWQLGPSEHVLMIVVHHIAADGASMPPLARDLATAYLARLHGAAPAWAPLPVHFSDYCLSQQQVLGSESDPTSVLSRHLEYWRHALAGAPDVLSLPMDRPRHPNRSTSVTRLEFTIDVDRHRGLVDIAYREGATVFMVVHTIFAVVLARLADTDDIVIGTPVAGRFDAALEDMVGMFVNTLPLRARVDADSNFATMLARVRDSDLAALHHADVPLDRIVEAVQPVRSDTYAPIFQVVLEFQDTNSVDMNMAKLAVEFVEVERSATEYELVLAIGERYRDAEPTGMSASFTYAADLFDPITVRGFADRFLRVLDAVVTNPSARIDDIGLLSGEETAQLAPAHGACGVVGPVLPRLLSAGQLPDATAVITGERELTYGELDDASNRLARVLIEAGVGPEATVALVLPRSLEAVVAVWAVAKAGGAFVPIEPGEPDTRIKAMVFDADSVTGLTLTTYRERLPDTIRWLHLDSPDLDAVISSKSSAAIDDLNRTTPLHPQHPAYLVYTSGSTGTPKGVVVTHAGLANLAAEMKERFGLTPSARILAAASPRFDVSIMEWLAAATSAATLVLAPPTVTAGVELADWIADFQVTHVAVTPAVLATMAPEQLHTLRMVVLGGEACPPDLVERWARGRAVVNTFGATETTIMAIAHSPLSRPQTAQHQGPASDGAVPIGQPVRGFTAVVLDRRMRTVPPSVVGELYLSGAGVARGYAGLPGLTAGRFVANPFVLSGARMYRTGDLVVWNHDRTLRYVGRADRQIKNRGHRIEPSEIEAALRSHAHVSNAAVTSYPHADGRMHLAGYVVPTSGAAVDVSAVRQHLGHRLPLYMIPTSIILLDHIPLTVTGKLDHRALPVPNLRPVQYQPPSTGLEAAICEAYERILTVERVGAEDNFFALGGNSLAAGQLVDRLQQSIGITVPIRWVFTELTPRSLAQCIDAGRYRLDAHDSALAVVLPLQTGDARPALFCIHPVSGLAWGFSGLVQHLDSDLPVYGLQIPTLTDQTETFESVDELASRYLREIRSRQPDGPYHLLGYSLGGVIAHAIAVQLQRDGADVVTLAMMDSRLPSADTPPADPLADLILGLGVPFDDRTDNLTIDTVADLLHQHGGIFTELTAQHLVTLHDKGTRLANLARNHRPAPFGGNLIYFTATDSPGGGDNWNDHITGWIADHPVHVTHARMTERSALAIVGAVLAEHIRKTQLGHSESRFAEN